ncbi:MAG: hypothetical protein JSS42_16290, partial [Proteobacteria bacterium]|nr:hypothetical protein [Pseudomonadota bacterium]
PGRVSLATFFARAKKVARALDARGKANGCANIKIKSKSQDSGLTSPSAVESRRNDELTAGRDRIELLSRVAREQIWLLSREAREQI